MKRWVSIPAALVLGTATTLAAAWWVACTQRRLEKAWPNATSGFRAPIPPGAPGVKAGFTHALAHRRRTFGSELWDIALVGGTDSRIQKDLEPLALPFWVRRAALPWEHGSAWTGVFENSRTVLARGWPFVTLWSDIDHRVRGQVFGAGAAFPMNWPWWKANTPAWLHPPAQMEVFPFAVVYDLPLPLRPIWPNFPSAVLMWAAPWWVIITTPGRIRRWVRRRGGRCPACGYDRQGLAAGAPCPECGGAPRPPRPDTEAPGQRA